MFPVDIYCKLYSCMPIAEFLNILWFSFYRFAHTNPLHMDVFQSVVRFEAEVVTMTAALLGGSEKAAGGQICGNMTSGGTESILLAVKSSRDYMKSKKGITRPEMLDPYPLPIVVHITCLINYSSNISPD